MVVLMFVEGQPGRQLFYWLSDLKTIGFEIGIDQVYCSSAEVQVLPVSFQTQPGAVVNRR
jgi:hypothetical protein